MILAQLVACNSNPAKVDISGDWTVRLDSTDVGINEGWQGQLYADVVKLPGTLDDAKIGKLGINDLALDKDHLYQLSRTHRYVGPAWYSRIVNVPESMKGKDLILNLERVLWDTMVWIDGERVPGNEESLSTGHHYDVTSFIEFGKDQVLTIRIDNRERYDVSIRDLCHAYTDHTQIIWNGVIGDMNIEAVEKVRVDAVKLFPDVKNAQVKAVITLNNSGEVTADATVVMKVAPFGEMTVDTQVEAGKSEISFLYKMGENFELWSEFNPHIYTADVTVKSGNMVSSREETFGMRQLENDGNRMMLNGKPLFLRGTLECCIFPLTGRPDMERAGWEKIFSTAREYGLNHLRFHSWCPPEAAFEVADEMGFYCQVELPVWSLSIGEDMEAVRFLYQEADRIIEEYGNHPSFAMWSLGNELEGDFDILNAMVDNLKHKDQRHLYTASSFTFKQGHGVWPEPHDDYYVTQWTNKGWVRGQGVFNEYAPSFNVDFESAIEGMNVPVVTHEVGQYCMYPDLTEIDKYTGVLKPINFMSVKADLEKKGLLHKANDYLMASGKLATLLYKEEIERALKTSGFSGFQLLDLHDYPGQGSALVGVLNAFYESKGIISGKEFREFCCPVVPLISFPKATYWNNETFNAEIQVCNYGPEELNGKDLVWTVYNGDEVVKTETVKNVNMTFGYNGNLGEITLPLAQINKAARLEVVLSIKGTEYINRWNVWVYPEATEAQWGNVKYTRDYAEASKLLAEGENVLFNPDWKTMKGIEGKFVPVFWSPVHFFKQAGTMGVLCDPAHKALADFPTDMHSDWQWWDLNTNSTIMVVDEVKGGSPIVEMVDSFTNNRCLASLYEGTVGNGKLMLATFDLQNNLSGRPVANQMLRSLLSYMNSADFQPSAIENFDSFRDVFGTVTNTKKSPLDVY